MSAGNRATGTVLAVDDEPENLELLRSILGATGAIDVRTVADPRLALETFRRVDPDLVLLDVHMPHLDGFEVMEQLRAATPDDGLVPIVVMTADADPATRRRALRQGGHDFVNKPFDTAEVRLRVRNLLRTSRLHRQLQEQRQALEERVAERTRDLQHANERLRAADRTKSDFLAMVSHEMRTPLTVIKGFTELVFTRWERITPEQRELHLDAIRRSTDRLQRMIDNLLIAAHLETGRDLLVSTAEPATVAIDDLLAQTIADGGLDATDVVVQGGDVRVEVDAALIQHVLANLLENARQYGAPPIEVRCDVDQGVLRIAVRDHGPGVPPSFADQLFERFAQASVGDRRTATGAGLGLWIARQLVRAHGGDVTYEPADPGARFCLRIPAHQHAGRP